MPSNMVLAISALLAMVCLGTAAPDPQYQKPNDVVAVEESSASNQCRDSSFSCMYLVKSILDHCHLPCHLPEMPQLDRFP